MSRSMWLPVIACAGAFLAFAGAAQAQFGDNFELYPVGDICGMGGWQGWVGSVDVCGDVSTDFAFNGTKSLKIVGDPGGSAGQGNDTVHRFPAYAGGTWTFSVQTYVPSTATGAAYIIMLNTYDDPPGSPIGTYRWSLQVHLDADAGTVIADFGGETVPLIYDQWVEFRAVINLDADLVDYYYNCVQFVTGKSWINGVSIGGVARIEALDLYGGEPGQGGTTGTYYDRVTLGRCPCDWNHDGVVNSQDFFDFLAAFFAGQADFNGNCATNSQDFFDFLACFFAPPPGC